MTSHPGSPANAHELPGISLVPEQRSDSITPAMVAVEAALAKPTLVPNTVPSRQWKKGERGIPPYIDCFMPGPPLREPGRPHYM